MLRRIITTVVPIAALIVAGTILAAQGTGGPGGIPVDPAGRPLVATIGGPTAADLAPAIHAVLGGADPVVLSDAGLYNPVVAPVFDTDGRVHLTATWEQLGPIPDFEAVVMTADWIRPQLACTEWDRCTDEAGASEFAANWATEAVEFWTTAGVDVVWLGWLPFDTDPAAPGVSWPSEVVNGWFADGLDDVEGTGSVVFIDVSTGLADATGDMLVTAGDGSARLRSDDGAVCPPAALMLAERVGFAVGAGWPDAAPAGWDDPSTWWVWPAARGAGGVPGCG